MAEMTMRDKLENAINLIEAIHCDIKISAQSLTDSYTINGKWSDEEADAKREVERLERWLIEASSLIKAT